MSSIKERTAKLKQAQQCDIRKPPQVEKPKIVVERVSKEVETSEFIGQGIRGKIAALGFKPSESTKETTVTKGRRYSETFLGLQGSYQKNASGATLKDPASMTTTTTKGGLKQGATATINAAADAAAAPAIAAAAAAKAEMEVQATRGFEGALAKFQQMDADKAAGTAAAAPGQ